MITGILNLLDVYLDLHPPKPVDPPDPPSNISKDRNEMLTHLYAELGEEMRALRATELSIAGLFYGVAAIIFAGNTTLLASDSPPLLLKIACVIGTIIFFLYFWVAIHARIAHDNASYSHLMSRRRFLERKWFWPEMPGKPETIGDGGSGHGYRKTQYLISLSALSVIFILVSLLATQLYEKKSGAARVSTVESKTTEDGATNNSPPSIAASGALRH